MDPQDCWPIAMWVGIHTFLFCPPFLPFIVRLGIIGLAMFASTLLTMYLTQGLRRDEES